MNIQIRNTAILLVLGASATAFAACNARSSGGAVEQGGIGAPEGKTDARQVDGHPDDCTRGRP